MAGVKGMKLNMHDENSPRCAEYYKKQNPLLTDEVCEEKAKKFRKSCKFNCIEYYERFYPELSGEEQRALLQKALKRKKSNNPNDLDYYISKYPNLSSEEQEKMWHEYTRSHNYQCKEYYINKGLSEEEAIKKCNEKIKIAGEKISKKVSGELNGMHSSKTSKEKRNSISPKRIEFYERKYPELSHEEHLKMLQKQYDKTNKSNIDNGGYNTTIEYYLNKGMTEIEARNALHDRQVTFSLEKCIERYGEDEGVKKFLKRQQKWLKSLYKNFQANGDGRSKQSKFAKDIIKYCCKQLNIVVPKKEKYMYDNLNKCVYAYDFTYNNKIIEFQGDYWHCNPNLYECDFFNKVKQKTAQEIWDYDNQKKNCAELNNYKVLHVWEYDYNNNKEETLKKCIDFLNDD